MSARAAWREPMLWLVFALPLAVLVAAASMIVRAAGGTDVAAADVRRTAQVQTEDLAADLRAAQLGLRGELALDAGGLVLHVPGAANGKVLHVSLEHPSQAALDRRFELAPQGGEWRVAVATLDTRHGWVVRVGDAEGRWRLQGRWPANAALVTLTPAVAR